MFVYSIIFNCIDKQCQEALFLLLWSSSKRLCKDFGYSSVYTCHSTFNERCPVTWATSSILKPASNKRLAPSLRKSWYRRSLIPNLLLTLWNPAVTEVLLYGKMNSDFWVVVGRYPGFPKQGYFHMVAFLFTWIFPVSYEYGFLFLIEILPS